MRIAVVGAGGVGGYYGGRLAQAGYDTTFIVRGETLDALRTRGLRVDSIAGDFTLEHVNATDDPSTVGEVDAILMTVKSWQLADAARTLMPMIGRDTMVVPLENGVDAPQELAEIVGREHVLGGLCGLVSFKVAPGHIRHAGAEPMAMFGEIDGRRSERVERLLEAFVRAGIKTEIPPDIHRSMWTKFLFIAPLSGMGAITRVPVGVWRSMPARARSSSAPRARWSRSRTRVASTSARTRSSARSIATTACRPTRRPRCNATSWKATRRSSKGRSGPW